MKAQLLFSLLLVFVPCSALAQSEPARPNIIVVMPDDLAYGDYGCLGNPTLKTPSVDAFMKESLLLTRFHVSPTCAPTRAALMSGRHEFKCGVTHTILRVEVNLKADRTYLVGVFQRGSLFIRSVFQSIAHPVIGDGALLQVALSNSKDV